MGREKNQCRSVIGLADELVQEHDNQQVVNVSCCTFYDSNIYIAFSMSQAEQDALIERLYHEKAELYERLLLVERERTKLLERLAGE